eukprot:scaffold7298_cov150-Skeletonema_menzelii.AAC.28
MEDDANDTTQSGNNGISNAEGGRCEGVRGDFDDTDYDNFTDHNFTDEQKVRYNKFGKAFEDTRVFEYPNSDG